MTNYIYQIALFILRLEKPLMLLLLPREIKTSYLPTFES